MTSNNNDDNPGDDHSSSAGPKGSDRALLDRLNALKPSNVSLDSSSSPTFTPASTIERAKPPSREDALSDRLKSLRNQMAASEPEPATAAPREAIQSTAAQGTPLAPVTVYNADAASGKLGARSHQADKDGDNNEDIDPLLSMPDDQTLEDLLADLESDQQWVEEVANQEEEDQHRRAMALLKELSPGKDRKTSGAHGGDDGGDDKDDSDDSDGEVMAREADDLIAKAMDEIDLDRKNTPQTQQDNEPTQATDTEKDTSTKDKDKSPFELPSVPSDPSGNHNADPDDNFAASIASRMAALKVTSTSPSSQPAQLPSVPSTEPDPFAAMLPSAPTFSPQDPKSKPAVVTGIVKKRAGFTDEDQKSWCTVCLEDGTMRCLGCDEDDGRGSGGGDVYCSRCWHEMHVGPQAGYDERGHKWEKYERDRKG